MIHPRLCRFYCIIHATTVVLCRLRNVSYLEICRGTVPHPNIDLICCTDALVRCKQPQPRQLLPCAGACDHAAPHAGRAAAGPRAWRPLQPRASVLLARRSLRRGAHAVLQGQAGVHSPGRQVQPRQGLPRLWSQGTAAVPRCVRSDLHEHLQARLQQNVRKGVTVVW